MKRKVVILLLSAFVLAGEHVRAAVVEDLSFQIQDEITRLVLVLNGELPGKVDTSHRDRVVASFDNLKLSSRVSDKLKNLTLPSGIGDFKAREGPQGSIEISFSSPPRYVERLILPALPPSAGRYRLIFDMMFVMKAEEMNGGAEERISEVSEPFSKEGEEKKEILRETESPVIKSEHVEHPGAVIPFVEAFYKEAQKAFEEGQYRRAFVLFDRYLQKGGETHRVDAFYGRAFSFYEMNRGKEADFGFDMIQLLGEALSADNTHEKAFEAQCLTAMIYFTLGVTKRAEDMFEELKRKAKTDEERLCVLKGLGMIEIKNGDYVRAVSVLNDARLLEVPEHEKVEVYFLLGQALSGAGAYSEALRNFGLALGKEPAFYLENPEIMKSIGEAFFALRDYQSAQEFLTWYINLNDQAHNDSMVWAEIAESMLQNGKVELAERLQDKIIVEMPDTEGAYITLLRKAQHLEDKGSGGRFQAETIYQDLSKKNLPIPLKEIAFFRWADLKRREGKVDEALDIVNHFVSTAPPSVPLDEFLVLKGVLLNEAVLKSYEQKAYNKVTSLYESADENVEWSTEALRAVASSYDRLEMYPQALAVYEKLASAGKASEDVYLSMARIASLLGDTEKAEKYALLLKKAENLKEKLSLLARIYMERGDYNKAMEQFEELAKLKSMSPELTLLYLECAAALNRCNLVFSLADKILSENNGLADAARYRALSSKLECYRKAGNVAESIKVAEEMIKVAPDETVRCQTLYLLASLQKQNGDMKKTELTLQELSRCGDPLWKRVAEQELAFMKLTESQNIR